MKSSIERALTIAPNLPDAHLALGLFYYWVLLDYDSALRELDRTVELQPSDSISRMLRAAIYRRHGEWRRSLAEFERAGELDPRDAQIPGSIGQNYVILRRCDDAEHALTHAAALDPRHVITTYYLAPHLHQWHRRYSTRQAGLGGNTGQHNEHSNDWDVDFPDDWRNPISRRFGEAFR